jgi:hypothetical protein
LLGHWIGLLFLCALFIMDQLSKRVYDLSDSVKDKSRKLKAFLEAHPSVDVNLHRGEDGDRALSAAAYQGHVACTRLLIDAKADLKARSNDGTTALYWASRYGNLDCVEVLIESKADVQTATDDGVTPAHVAAHYGQYQCLNLLIDAKADVNARDNNAWTPAMAACQEDRLTCLQMLVDAKADLAARCNNGYDSVYSAMRLPSEEPTHRVPGMPFAVLSCNTDIKNVRIDKNVTPAMVSSHINEYTQVQHFIDDYHTIFKHALSEDAVVDKRVGRGDYGVYHEPLEQVLLYLGLSMKKNQTANSSIDGKTIRRALIPGHPINANLWFELYQRTHCSSCSTRRLKLKECTCNTARYCNNNCQRKHWPTHMLTHQTAMRKKKNTK